MKKKKKLHEIVVNDFNDDGKTDKNELTCKYCGENLGTIKYDDTEGFAKSGQIKMSREIWNEDSSLFQQKQIIEEDIDNICNSIKFRESLIKEGYSIKLLKKIQLMCNKIIDISTKIGIRLLFDDLIKLYRLF